jgi:hypothetical protein
MRFSEYDLTDHAHKPALERHREGLVVQAYHGHRLTAWRLK